EGDALLVAEVLAEVPEVSPPSPPRREHHLDLRARLHRARRVRVSIVVALGHAITAPAADARGEPLLQGAQRDHDRLGEVLELHVGVLFAQLQDVAAEGVAVVGPLGLFRDAAGVGPDEGHHGAAQLVRHVAVDLAWRRRGPANGAQQRGQDAPELVAHLVGAATRDARGRDDLLDRRTGQPAGALVLVRQQEHASNEHGGDSGADVGYSHHWSVEGESCGCATPSCTTPRWTAKFVTSRQLRAGATVFVTRAPSPARCSLRGGEASSPPRRRARSGPGARRQLEQALAQEPNLGHAALARDLEELQAPLAEIEQVARVTARARLDAREDLVDAPIVPVRRDEQTAEGVVRTRVVVPVEVRRETTPHLGEVVEAVGVEELLVEVGVEDLHLPVPLLVLRLEVIGPELGQERREARDALPRPEG